MIQDLNLVLRADRLAVLPADVKNHNTKGASFMLALFLWE
jgi:hypothetical protein